MTQQNPSVTITFPGGLSTSQYKDIMGIASGEETDATRAQRNRAKRTEDLIVEIAGQFGVGETTVRDCVRDVQGASQFGAVSRIDLMRLIVEGARRKAGQ